MPTIHVPYTLMARQRHRPPLLLALILLILLVTGCVDDDTQDTMAPQDTAAPQDTTAPQARITFPGAAALTTATQLTVCGTAQDQRSITGVTVNGVPAISTDGFATWVAQVTLPLGMNEVVVGTIDEVGNTEARAAVAMITVVETLFPFENFRALGMAVEASGTLVVAHSGGPVETSKGLRIIVGVEPGAVVRVNPRTGARTIISDATTGSGPALVRPILNGAIAVEASGAFVVPGSDPSTFDPRLVAGRFWCGWTRGPAPRRSSRMAPWAAGRPGSLLEASPLKQRGPSSWRVVSRQRWGGWTR